MSLINNEATQRKLTDGNQIRREREREGVKPETEQSKPPKSTPRLDGNDFEFSTE